MIRKVNFLLVFAVLSFGFGCDDDSRNSAPSSDGGIEGKSEGSQEDPMEVLKVFVAAVKDKDKEKCLSLIHPSNREELSRDMEQGFPPVPEPLNLQINTSADGQTASFSGVPALKNLKLRKDEGKWWIAD